MSDEQQTETWEFRIIPGFKTGSIVQVDNVGIVRFVAKHVTQPDADRIIADHNARPKLEQAVAWWKQAATYMAEGHCEDKFMHRLIPYETVLWCDCGFRHELAAIDPPAQVDGATDEGRAT